ncbi:hypothetical protein KDL44_03860 [bacterium]|nr:hypothetical protein [bacterium]
MRFPDMLTRSLALCAVLVLMWVPARAEEVVTGSDTGESINRILRKIEEMAGILALSKTLDEDQTRQFIEDLSQLHGEVKGLKQANELLLQIARQAVKEKVEAQNTQPETPAAQPQQPAAQPETPPAQPQTPAAQPETPANDPEAGTTPPAKTFDEWQPYLDFKLDAQPQDASYNGWVEKSSIDILWGEPGQMILKITNGYSATWTFDDAYTGSPSVNVSTRQQGEIVVQVRDDEGLHEYSIRNGGLGPVFMRWISEKEVAGNPA